MYAANATMNTAVKVSVRACRRSRRESCENTATAIAATTMFATFAMSSASGAVSRQPSMLTPSW